MPTPSKSTSTRRVYLPQAMNIPMPATQEYPAGRTVQLAAGYVDLDEGMQNHPILAKLQTVDPDETQRQDKIRDAEEEYSEIMSKAAEKLAKVKADVGQERREAINKASEDYMERRQDALARGNSFNEPHPDLETQRAMALTAPAGLHASVNPVAFTPTPAPPIEQAQKLPTEAESQKRMTEASQNATGAGNPDATRPTGRSARD